MASCFHANTPSDVTTAQMYQDSDSPSFEAPAQTRQSSKGRGLPAGAEGVQGQRRFDLSSIPKVSSCQRLFRRTAAQISLKQRKVGLKQLPDAGVCRG